VEVLDNVNEMQSFQNFFSSVNDLLHPYMEFDEVGNLKNISYPEALTETEKKEILSYLWRLENNRTYKLAKYNSILDIMQKLKRNIEFELKP
jgi:hypothetical protein